MYYYAHGSNLSTPYVRCYCPSATFVMRAELPNYKVEFRHYSTESEGGISSIIEAPGHLVCGVIYEVLAAELVALDELESVPEGLYKREEFLVKAEDGAWHRADLYRVVQPKGPFPPSKAYVEKMIAGAREHGLDAAYVEGLVKRRRTE